MRLSIVPVVMSLLLYSPLLKAQCSGGSSPTGKACGAIPFQGCCDGEVLLFCEGGELCSLDCGKVPHCGWDPGKAYYDCESEGMSGPSARFSKECPAVTPDACQGVDYAGCCAGDAVYWCNGQGVAMLDCSQNGTLNRCGINSSTNMADCVGPEAAEFKSCPFAPGDVVLDFDVASADVGPGAEVAGRQDLLPSLDGLVVPDLNAPSICSTLAKRYDVTSSDCGVFAAFFLVKQEGCAALFVDLVPSADTHPAAKVTQSGVAFDFHDAGKQRQCMAQIDEDGLKGQCFWDVDSSCEFVFAVHEVPVVQPAGPENGEKNGGGCSGGAGASGGGRAALLLLALLLVSAVRTSRTEGRNEPEGRATGVS